MSDATNPFQNRNELKDHFEVERLRAELAAAIKERDEARGVLRNAYVILAFCFNRLHGSARSRDGELCSDIAKCRAEIKRTRALAQPDETKGDGNG